MASFYVYARETADEANIAGVMTFDEARPIAVNVGSCLSCLEQTNERPQSPSQSAKSLSGSVKAPIEDASVARAS
jgi:hypothetical protein